MDGQQRVLTLLLVMLCLDPGASFPLLDNATFSERDTQANMRANYELIADWVGYRCEHPRDSHPRWGGRQLFQTKAQCRPKVKPKPNPKPYDDDEVARLLAKKFADRTKRSR